MTEPANGSKSTSSAILLRVVERRVKLHYRVHTSPRTRKQT
jgi:hypothetical protein